VHPIIVKLWSVWLTIILISGTASGHVVQQIFLTLEKSGQEWELQSTFDAAYALPEFRDDANEPQPDRKWLLSLSDTQHDRLKKEAESYLRKSLDFTHGGKNLGYQITFPDYETTPPDFPTMLNGGAYFTIICRGTLPPNTAGDFQIRPHSGSLPDFVVATGPKSNRQYHVAAPGTHITLFTTTASGGTKATESNGLLSILIMGYRHVLPMGMDHMLFILALFLMSRKWRPLLAQSLAFTVAHSITLGLAASGVFQIGQWSGAWLIEPLIALSIAVVATENLFTHKATTHRLVVVFLFGLVHGLGFAGSLATALDQGSTTSLLALGIANLGVELAQVTILTVAWIATLYWWRRPVYQKFRALASFVIAIIGIAWMIERLIT